MTYILGVSAFIDSAATLIKDVGISATQEEDLLEKNTTQDFQLML